MTEICKGMIVDTQVTQAGTQQEWDAGINMLAGLSTRASITAGADKGYDTEEFVYQCRWLHINPHVPARVKGSQLDKRNTDTLGYKMSQVRRKRIKECFGWMKDFGKMRKLRHRGQALVSWIFRFTAAAYNITRMKRLLA